MRLLGVSRGVLLVAALVVLAPSRASAGASHTRMITDNGPVHVWKPAHYDRAHAGIVVYVHGYFTDVDRAWQKHHLARQFADSGLNALFVACEAPTGARDDVSWNSIEPLLAAVAAHLDDGLPTGRVIAVGHSGAHRTLASWIADERIDTIVLIDALYQELPLADWLDERPDRRLINTAAVTQPSAQVLHRALPETLAFRRFPGKAKLRGARDARVVYVRSQYDHMELVTGGVALPMLLRALQVPRRSEML